MDDATYRELKYMTSKLYSLCNKLWPKEFAKMYHEPPAVFRDWLNKKSGLDIDHTVGDKKESLNRWLTVIESKLR